MPASSINPLQIKSCSDLSLSGEREHIMGNHIVTGIGCFAQPQKLSRIFLRMVHTYALGQLDTAELIEGCNCRKSECTKLIRTLIEGQPTGSNAATGATAAPFDNQKVTGFYLTFRGNRLELSIFAKNRTQRQEIHSAVLDK